MTRPWAIRSALSALLDALEADMLAAPTQEVQAALRETARARQGAVHEIRSLFRDAQAGSQDMCASAMPPDDHDGIDTQQH